MQNSDRLQSTVYVDNTKYYGSSNKLIVLSNGQITEYDLAGMKKDRLFFGSSMQCDIVINDPVISEIQGKIKLVNDMVYVSETSAAVLLPFCFVTVVTEIGCKLTPACSVKPSPNETVAVAL